MNTDRNQYLWNNWDNEMPQEHITSYVLQRLRQAFVRGLKTDFTTRLVDVLSDSGYFVHVYGYS